MGGFSEYDQDIKNLQEFYMVQAPAGPYRRLIMLEFVQKAMVEAAEFFQKSIVNELDLQKNILGE